MLSNVMAKLYLDEDCSDKRLKEKLIKLGHNIKTTQEANNVGKDDQTQLVYAISQNRAIVTLDVQIFFNNNYKD